MERSSKKLTKSAWSWALYDWANSAFATTIMAGFFPIFFKSYWASDLSDAESTFAIGSVNSIVGLLIAFSAPVLGALADAGNSKRKFLFSFAFLGILTTGYLFFIPESSWKLAIIFYAFGVIGFSGGNIFYDALIINVSKPEERNRVFEEKVKERTRYITVVLENIFQSRNISASIRSYWTQFARTGDPGRGRGGDLPSWELWNGERKLVFDASPDGGVRMESAAIDIDEVHASLWADPYLTDDEKCSVYKDMTMYPAYPVDDLKARGCW